MEQKSILGQIFSSAALRGSYSPEKPLINFEMKGSGQEKRRLTALINEIAKFSPLGKSVLEEAAKGGFRLSFEPQLATAGFCGEKVESGCIENVERRKRALIKAMLSAAKL